jgi:hypothetical protein
LLSGQLAGNQFQSSDTAYLTTAVGLPLLQGWHIPAIVLVLVLAAIWWPVLKKAALSIFTVFFFRLLLTPPQAKAYFETTEKTEAMTVLPNQSAFWVPDNGDNKNSQIQFNSEDYWKMNKLAAKRFVIPHHKLGNSGGWMGSDSYVPDGRLFLVDRTPFSREWVDSTDRGSSSKKEGFPCQSSEGLNITVGVSIGAEVTEENAAKYLSVFGVLPPKGSPSDPQVIFTSVYYSHPFAEIMDGVVRKQVQTLICNELSARTLDKANLEANAIMEKVKGETAKYLTENGITLKFIGWADTFTFDPAIQKAINDRYIAATLQPALPVLQALAQIQVAEGAGKGLGEKGLPFVVTPDLVKNILGIVPQEPKSAK